MAWRLLVLALFAPAAQAERCTSLGDRLISFTFEPAPVVELAHADTLSNDSSKVLSGRGLSVCQDPLVFLEEHTFGDLSIVLTKYSGTCWTDSRYSDGDFGISAGTVSGGEFSFQSYRVSPPASQASAFTASASRLYVRVDPQETKVLYRLAGGLLLEEARVASEAGASTFLDTEIEVNRLSEDTVYVLLASGEPTPIPTRRMWKISESTACMDEVSTRAKLGDLALIGTKYDGRTCWTDGRYNNDEVLMEQGVLKGDDGSSVAAYRLTPPAKLATSFVGSKAGIHFRSSSDVVARTYVDGTFTQVATASPDSGSGYADTGLVADDLSEPTVFVFSQPSERISEWPLGAHGVEAAVLVSTPDHVLKAKRFPVGGRPFVPEQDWAHGPGTHSGNYGNVKTIFPVDRADGREGVVWEDQESRRVVMTWFAADLSQEFTTELLPASATSRLVGAASNGNTQIVLAFFPQGSVIDPDKAVLMDLVVAKFDIVTGEELKRVSLPVDSGSLDIHSMSGSGASMAWSPSLGRIAIVVARQMTNGHQGGIIVEVDQETLEMQNSKWASSHSFANSLTVDSAGTFLGMDLGDNYPRGISAWRLGGATSKTSHLVYAFKTRHASTDGDGKYDVYPEISTAQETFYKWSNDNYVYTELAHPGIVEVEDGILVFFTGEFPALDNSRIGSAMNDPRNAAFVKVSKDLTNKTILSEGPVVEGGFYSYGGGWSPQRIEGIVQLTSNTATDRSVSRMKTFRLSATNETLLWWELWSASEYSATQYMVVDDGGSQMVPVRTLDFPMRLGIADDPRVVGSSLVGYAGTPEGMLVRYEMCLDPEILTTTTVPDFVGAASQQQPFIVFAWVILAVAITAMSGSE